tara:strand:+ start:361 stop:2502 length:2142 start_codon:yes stop_codon:yes gene_type:complete
MIRHEIKSQLAKLLATEDLVVENKYVETAQFNVHTRVLTLPVWERASAQVYDMLVAHEVGHALYTPDSDWFKDRKISPQFVNIVEDVRIEKMMKRRYAGISKTFHRGYSELADEDFFCIENEDVNKMNLADRANLYFKIGKFVDIDFNSQERVLIQKISDAETFDDVLDVAEELYNHCKQQQEMKTKTDDLQVQGGQSEGEDQPETDSQEESTPSVPNGTNDAPGANDYDSDEFDSEEPTDSDSYGGTENDDEPEVSTAQSLEDALKDLASNEGWENVYLELPKLDLNRIVVPNAEVHSRFDEWNDFLERHELTEEEVFGNADRQFKEFKKSAQKEVNYLVKEFECRKAADSYARSTTARTGVLDCSKLHTYKYNEDLFKKVTTLADGKNHGLVFVLDWSGSMGNVLQDTLKQLFNLMWFCKKASIPFEVYAFTNEYPKEPTEETLREDYTQHAYEKREGLIAVGPWFSMMNIFSSSVKMKELEQQMKNFYRLSYNMTIWSHAPIPTGLSLSGTPLNEAFISLHQILPQFKKQHKVQKVQCVVLTDGEAGGMKYHKEVQRRWENGPFLGVGSVQMNAFLRNRKTGNTYSFDCEWWQMSDIFLKDLRDTFADVSFIGIRVLESRDAGSFIRRYCGWSPKFDKIQKVWKKERAFALHDAGYHTYFGMSSAALSNNSEFDVDEGASKAKIKSAFVKSLKSKKMNKKVLGEFIELIA